MLVGIPSLSDNDRFRGYRDDVIKHIQRALLGVDHEVFVTPPQVNRDLPGIVDAQNMLIDKCIDGDFDYLWLVQADVQVPLGSFQKLFGLDVDTAQGIVCRHDDQNALICGFMDGNKKVWYLPGSAVEGQILTGWVFAGMSCTLIRRRVLEAGIRFKYEPGLGEDILFLYDLQSHGFIAKVDGRVICGHLPEWPLPDFVKLDVGCGHRPKGDVNVDPLPDSTPHRSADQRICDDVPLKVKEIPNFVIADGVHLPFRDHCFEMVYSSHLIEHIPNREGLVIEMARVSAGRIEVRCPHGENPQAVDETKPLHLHRFHPSWFEVFFRHLDLRNIDVRTEFSQGMPWEIVAIAEVLA